MGIENVFTEYYRRNEWGSEETRSGTGSTIVQTASIRAELPKLVNDLQIKTMLDIPCGDFNWMKLLDLPLEYIGADLVTEMVEENQRKYGSAARRFIKLDLTNDPLPKADLILCRDCLFHLSNKDVRSALANIKRSGSGYLLVTTNTDLPKNSDIVSGGFRRLNLRAAPFALPEPIRLLDEKRLDGPDTFLGLWRVRDLP